MARRILNSSEYYTSYSVSTFLGQSQHMGATWTYTTLPPFDISPDLKIALSSLQYTHWLKPSRLDWQRLKRRLQRGKRTVEKQQLRLQQLQLLQLKVNRHFYFFWRNLAWGRKNSKNDSKEWSKWTGVKSSMPNKFRAKWVAFWRFYYFQENYNQ